MSCDYEGPIITRESFVALCAWVSVARSDVVIARCDSIAESEIVDFSSESFPMCLRSYVLVFGPPEEGGILDLRRGRSCLN